MDIVFSAIPFKAGDRIVTSVSEYGSNAVAFLQVAERTSRRLKSSQAMKRATLVSALAEMLDERVRLV